MIIEKKKRKIQLDCVNIFINTTFNNTLIYLADVFGNILVWSSAGSHDFKGSRKGTPYASRVAAKEVCKKFFDLYNIDNTSKKVFAEIFLKGPGAGAESAVRELSLFFVISRISNVTTIPHNGCRTKKARRV